MLHWDIIEYRRIDYSIINAIMINYNISIYLGNVQIK